MNKQIQIKLNSQDLGQLLDGLICRADSWARTAEYLETGSSTDSTVIIEECDDADEARQLSNHYSAIIEDIRNQIAEQGGL